MTNDQPVDRLTQFRLIHGAYVITLLASALATFGDAGIVVAIPICVFWGIVFSSPSRPRAFARMSLVALLISVLLSCLPGIVLGYSPRSAARRMQCSNNLKQIALALHNYHDTFGTFPPAYIADANGKPMHSWRVLVLPFLEEAPLYNQYSFDEPWDGPNNRQLVSRMPQVYACPSAAKDASGKPTYTTSYVAVVGPQTAWPAPSSRSIKDIWDGTSNTALLIEHNGSDISWLEPRDLAFEEAIELLSARELEFAGNHRWESFFYEYLGGRQVALGDGSVRYVRNGIPSNVWSALFEIEDGVRFRDEDFNVPEHFRRRLKVGNCVRLALFVFLMFLPLPWVWLNPTSRILSADGR